MEPRPTTHDGFDEACRDGLRFLRTLEALEPGETWNLPGIAIACGIWLVVGLVLARLTFRWIRKDG